MRKILMGGLAVTAIALGAGAYASQGVLTPEADSFRLLKLFGDVLAIVEQHYVVPVDDKKLIEASLDGMLSSLDPHSNYLRPEELKAFNEKIHQVYGGIGLEVTSSEADGAIKVQTVLDDTPSQRAGLLTGDYITAVNGQTIIGMSLNDSVNMLRGKPGTPVKLTVYRDGVEDPMTFDLIREEIKEKSVKAHLEGDYGVVRLSTFGDHSAEETEAALKKLRADDPKLKGIVLDLRNNPGGSLDVSVQVADDFLDSGEIVSQRGRDPKDITRYDAHPGDLAKGLPVAVLINSGTASAAEIVAGALQDHKRAVIVGLTSFGKGSVQSLIPLDDGRDGAVKLTIARYYTPSGRSIQKTGITPDIEVAQSLEQAKRVADAAYQFSEASYKSALDADEGKTRRGAHTVSEVPPENYDSKKGDFQLDRAFDVLAAKGDVKYVLAHPRGYTVEASEIAGKSGSKFDPKARAKQAAEAKAKAKAPETKTPPAPAAPTPPKP